MPDYRIYIHSFAGGGSDSSPTKPWDNQTGGNDTNIFKSAEEALQTGQQIATGGASSFISSGIAALSRVLPAVALAYVAYKITDNILTTGFSHIETYTGHYEYSMNLNNFKTSITNIINPIGLFMKQATRQAQFNLQNRRLEQERMLVGNSILNLSTKGV